MMRNEIEQLTLLGAMPDEADEQVTAAQIDRYANLLGKIAKPVTLDEASVLIKLFPPTALYGVEQTLLHLIESVCSTADTHQYEQLISECNSTAYKEMLSLRFNRSQLNFIDF